MFGHHLRLTQHRQVYARKEMLVEQTCIHVSDTFTVRHFSRGQPHENPDQNQQTDGALEPILKQFALDNCEIRYQSVQHTISAADGQMELVSSASCSRQR